MAYTNPIHRKKDERARKYLFYNGTKKYGTSSATPSTRRICHIIFGVFVGLLMGYTISSGKRHWSTMCIGVNNGFFWPAESSESKLSDEVPANNSESALLFVGVMTAQKYLDTRAVAVYNTWGKELPGKIAFFSSGTSLKPRSAPDLPLVALKAVDDSYPPQKKSFMMLQYMWEHYGDKFEWFMRADDDVYVKPDKIESFLRSIDSSKPYFIGQAGRGNQEEFGSLSLEYDENFCMGGPGIILSRETLSKVAQNVRYCLQNLYTTHEDVELGRCVQKFAHVSCTWSYEMQSIFYHNSSGHKAFTENLKKKEVHRAITLHPVKQYKHMYRIHNYLRGLKIHELQQKKVQLYRDVYSMQKLLNYSSPESLNKTLFKEQEYMNVKDAHLLGLKPDLNKFHPRDEKDVYAYDFISRSIYSAARTNPKRKLESYFKEGLDDVVREVMDNINVYSRERGRVIEFQQILYGYFRVNPLYGSDYILDMLLTYKKYRGRKMTVPVRRHAYLQQQFTGFEIREVDESLEPITNIEEKFEISVNKRNLPESIPNIFMEETTITDSQKLINFILPLSARFNTFMRFIKTYETVCLMNNENVALYIILFSDSLDKTMNDTLQVIHNLKTAYPTVKIKLVPVFDVFARAKALDYGMAQVDRNDLLFFIDVDMVWTSETLEKVRSNTVIGKSAYFPIVYSEFDPLIIYNRNVSPNHFLINEDSGYWRQFGYGIVSIYKQDIKLVGGFDTSIVGWGKEDVVFYEKFVATDINVTIFRSTDPNLVHIFHTVDCDSTLDESRLTMCRNTRTETYGSVNQLSNLIFKNKNAIFQFASLRNKSSIR